MQIPTRTKYIGLTAALFAGTAMGATMIGPALSQSNSAEPIVVQQPLGAPISFAELIEQVSPAVVSVNVISEQEVSFAQNNEEMFEFFRNRPGFEEFFNQPRNGQPETRESRSLGSGFFISADGLIVTNNHVVENATEIQVVLEDGRELEAELVGTDPRTDLAVLRVTEPGEYRFVEFETDVDVRRGDWVVALGNPFGFGGTATAGIVSANGRELRGAGPYTDYLQIDAAINRGNSGGPTFDLHGRVIGVNTAIVSPTGGSVGIGFAIPAELAEQITDQIVENGRVVRGWLGVSIQNFSEDMASALGFEGETGALVAEVVTNSPASRAGFRRNDVILEIDSVDMDNSTQVTRTVGGLIAGSSHEFTILRNGEIMTLDVTVDELPDNVAELPTSSGDSATPEGSGPGFSGEALGMSLSPLSDDDRRRLTLDDGTDGLVINRVEPGSPAARLGLNSGQAILEVNFESIASVKDFEDAVEAARENGRESVLVSVRLNRQTSVVALSIEED